MKLTFEITDTVWSRAGYDEDGDPIFDASTLEEQVAHVFAEKLLKKFTPDIGKWIRGLVEQRCEAAIETLVTETIMAPIQPTNTFGEPKGDPLTLREVLKQQCEAIVKRKVYARLDPRTNKVEIHDGYRRDGYQEMTAWEARLFAAASEGVPAVLDGAVNDAVRDLRERLKSQASSAIVDAVSKLLGLP